MFILRKCYSQCVRLFVDITFETAAKAEKKIIPTSIQLSLLQRQTPGEIVTEIAIPRSNGV
jgi:hypothetical protein